MLGHPISIADMKLSAQLKGLLKQRGTSVTNLARSTGVPAQTVHNWLAGSKPRDFDQVRAVADFFQVTLDFLIYGIETKSSNSPIKDLEDEINAGIYEVILRKVRKQ